MTWRDDLRRVTITVGGKTRNLVGASFRGVPFFVESIENTGGRRAVVHEFPLRDDPYVEDLGKKANGWRVDGYLLGDDYLTQKEALRSALQDVEGPGAFLNPYEGLKRAICTGLSTRESKMDGGFVALSIELQETPLQAPVPTEVVDSVGQVSTSADAAVAATDAELVEEYDPSGLPLFALASAETALTNALASLKTQLAPVITGTQELAAMTGQVALITAEASSLVRTPATILDTFRSVITGLVDTALAAPGAVMNALFAAYAADLGVPVVATTATRARELANQNALIGGLRRVMAIEAARLAPKVTFATIDEATAARDTVADQLEEQAEAAGDTAYPALVDLRSQVLRAVPGSSDFARVVTVTRPTAIPSLLLAYQLYGDVTLEADILARNNVKHPGFIAGDVKVLSDG